MPSKQHDPVRVFKALSDETRLRILGLLDIHELSVNDIAEILSSTQSRVSRHINVLKDAGFLDWRREGTWSYYRRPEENEMNSDVIKAWGLVRDWARNGSPHHDDKKRLREVLRRRRQRSKKFFGQYAQQWDHLREQISGYAVTYQSFESIIPPTLQIADVGTGTGHILIPLARVVNKAIGIDQAQEMLELARHNAKVEGLNNVELREGVIESLPCHDQEVDAAFASLVLHHAPDPSLAIVELARIIKPGGTVCIIDLQSHNEEWMRTELAHNWLGFEEDDIRRWFSKAGLTPVRWAEGFSTPTQSERKSAPPQVKSFIFYGRK